MFRASVAVGKMLPPSVMGLLPQSEHSIVHFNLVAYFQQFGTTNDATSRTSQDTVERSVPHSSTGFVYPKGTSNRYEHENIHPNNGANLNGVVTAHHETSTSDSHNDYRVSNANTTLQSYEDAIPYRPTGTARKQLVPAHLSQHPHALPSLSATASSSHPYSYIAPPTLVPPPPPPLSSQPRIRTNPHEAHHTYDLNSIPEPPPPHRQGTQHTPTHRFSSFEQMRSVHSSSAMLFSPQTDRDYDTDSTGSASDDQLSSEYNTEYTTPHKAHKYDRGHYNHESRSFDAPAPQNDLPFSASTQDFYSSRASFVHHSLSHRGGNSSNTSFLSASAAARAVSPAAFGSAAPRFPAPPSYTTPNRAADPRARPNRYELQAGLDTGTGSTSGHSNGSEGSPQTDFEYEYDSDHGPQNRSVRPVSTSRGGRRVANAPNRMSNSSFAAPSSITKPALSAEDLRISYVQASCKYARSVILLPFYYV